MTELAQRYGSGAVVRRIEDPALVQGHGQFTDDVAPPRQLFAAFARSPHAHARIVSIDTGGARAMPGVVGLWTGAELAAAGVRPIALATPFKRPDGRPMSAPPKRALAYQFVRYVGEPVALVVADSPGTARAAADAVTADYEALSAVADGAAAIAAGAPRVCSEMPDNRCAEARHGDAAAVQRAFDQAAVRVALDLDNQRLAPAAMEPRALLAWVDEASGRLTLRASSQMPTGLRDGVAASIPGLAPQSVRVLVGDVGGGFGMKTGMYAEDLAVAWAALQLKRPVKWQATRLEDFLSAVHGRDLNVNAEMALDANGRVLALRVRGHANVGAYPSTAAVAIQLLIGPWVLTSVYDIAAIDLHLTAVLTHTAPAGPYRGAGRPENIYIVERLMDAAATELGLDPAELRRRNLIRADQMPYRNPMGQVYDCGRFESILDQALELGDWAGFDSRAAASRARGRLRGRSVTSFLEWTGGNVFDETATVRLLADGTIEIFSATQAMGQGIATSYAQLAVDVFGVPIDRIRIVQGDTDRGTGFGSAGSRSLFTGGPAVQVASKRALDAARDLAAQALEAPARDLEYAEGRFAVAGTDLSIGLGEIAARQAGGVVTVSGDASAGAASWPNACHVCEVEIDPATGEVRVVAFASVNDIGRVISPQIARGQVEGGAVQGIGQALCERIAYDSATGQLLSASLMDYALPRADGFIDFRTEFDPSIPCLTNSLGAKGVGELGTIGATPAVVNAVIDALQRAGVRAAVARSLQMPLLAERVWRALRAR
jgi:carbon-monoxide dehydrogenase large subunit